MMKAWLSEKDDFVADESCILVKDEAILTSMTVFIDKALLEISFRSFR